MKQKQSERIRQIKDRLGNSATNKNIQDEYTREFGVKPSSQSIYATLGRETDRMLENYNARQMADLKRVAATSFDNDFGNMRTAVVAAGQYIKQQ